MMEDATVEQGAEAPEKPATQILLKAEPRLGHSDS